MFCPRRPSVLDPAGPGARSIEGLWWLMLWISAAVFVITVAMIGYAVLKRTREDAPEVGSRWEEPFVVVAGAVLPSVILAAVFVVSLTVMVPNPFYPAVLLPGVTFLLLYLWPFLEARVTHDHEAHQLLDRPRDRPVRTALGAATLTFYVVLFAAASNDVIAKWFQCPSTA